MSFPVARDRAAAKNLHACNVAEGGRTEGAVVEANRPRTCRLAAGDEGEEKEPEREQERDQAPIEENAPGGVADPVKTVAHHLIRRHVACFDVKTA
jgi:hypothetical protein